jgi:bifunctional non-homologous end joining protein LigD
MAAMPVQKLPEGDEWLYELKLDGYRALLIKNGLQVQLRSRNDKDLTRMYPAIAVAGLKINAEQAVIDGEIVVLDEQGRPSFQALQHRGEHPHHTIVFYAFDVLHVDGRDFTGEPLEQRRIRLPQLLHGKVLRISEELPGTAAQIIEAVQRMGLEGVIAKRRGSLYVPGERSRDWRKLKLENQQEFVIGGYRPAGDNSIDALLVGYYEGKQLRFAGKVRAGLVPHSRRELATKLAPLRIAQCPFGDLPSGKSRWGGGVTAEQMHEMQWTRPQLVAQIRFVQWTAEGRLRHAAYLGLRIDKAAADVRRES